MEDPTIDCNFTLDQVLENNQDIKAPREVLDQQVLITVKYYSFDNKLHQGQIVVNKQIEKDIKDLFLLIERIKFPIEAVIPTNFGKTDFSDETLASSNYTSGFYYRNVFGKDRLSNHSFGLAVDINPGQNPYIRNDYHQPVGVEYDSNLPGTLLVNEEVVEFMKDRGFDWGGDWLVTKGDRVDYMHFEKPQDTPRI